MTKIRSVPLGEVLKGAAPGFACGENLQVGIVQLRMNNVTTGGSLDWSTLRRVPANGRKTQKYVLTSGDVVFNHTNSPELVGKTALFRGFKEPVLYSNHFLRLRVDESSLDPRYLSRWLNFQWKNRIFEKLCTQWVNQATVRRDDLLGLEIALPPLADQKRIAAILERADRLRRLRRYGLEQWATILPAAFLEIFGDLEREPTRWIRIEFDELCRVSDATVDPKDARYRDLPQISSEDIGSVSGELGPLRTAKQKGIISVNFLVEPTEIVFSKIRPRLRKVAYPKIQALCSADIYPIRVLSTECHPQYLLFYLRSEYFSGIVSRLAEARCNIPKVNREELSDQTIPLPPFPLQQKFAELAERIERIGWIHRESLRQAEHLFQTLLHRAFTSGL